MNCGHYVPSPPTEFPVAAYVEEPVVPPVVRGDTVVTRPPRPKPKPSLKAIDSVPARYATCPACREQLGVLVAQMQAIVDGLRLAPSGDAVVFSRGSYAEYTRLVAEHRRLRALIAADRLRHSGELPPDPTTDRTGAAQ